MWCITVVFNTLSLYVPGHIANSQNFTKPPEAVQNQAFRESFKKHAQEKGTQVLYCQDKIHAKPLISKNLF